MHEVIYHNYIVYAILYLIRSAVILSFIPHGANFYASPMVEPNQMEDGGLISQKAELQHITWK